MSVGDDDVTRSSPVSADRSSRIGAYRLIYEIGRGGMGTVFLAARSDDAFKQRVAIKVLKRGMDSDAIVRRFRAERQILASLNHPYIANLIDGGTTSEGLPYFAMEYVDGQSIVEFAESRRLDTTARIELFRKVCAAVQYAHQNLIIHRDLKPGNVLVTSDGTPKLLDFGIAKLLDPGVGAHAATIPGPELMTPEYASPEQVRGGIVTTATDVYSLGVVLYELLTNRHPYNITSRTPAAIAEAVCNSVPVRPSTAVTHAAPDAARGTEARADVAGPETTGGRRVDAERLRKRLAGDLDTIVLKALSKEPSRRYASVDQFSEDLRRHLAGLPVIARKDTLGYRAAKFVQRNRAAVATAALTVVALIAGVIGTTWQARVARAERARAEQRFNDVRELANTALFDLHDAIGDLPGSTPARQLLVSKGLQYLDKLARDAGDRPDLLRELAGAYVKLGDVQGRPLHPNLGDVSGALESYRKATEFYESLGAATSPDLELRRALANAHLRLSEVLSSAGHTATALVEAKQGMALQQAIAADASGEADVAVPADVRRELAISYTRVGDLLSATGDTAGALEHRRLALALMETVAAADPHDPSNLRQLGIAHQKLGNTLGNPNAPNVGDYAGALTQLERAAQVFRDASAAHPTNAAFKRYIAVISSNAADVLGALDRPEEALARQRSAFAIFTELSDGDPANAAARNDVAISLSKIAEMLDNSGKGREAIQEYGRVMAIHKALTAADPANDAFRLELASDYNRLATAQMKLGERTPALANHTQALTISRALHRKNPDNVELAVAVCLALASRGDAYVLFARRASGDARRSDLEEAARDYAAAVELMSGLEARGAIEGTDLATLENARKQLAAIRTDLSSLRTRGQVP